MTAFVAIAVAAGLAVVLVLAIPLLRRDAEHRRQPALAASLAVGLPVAAMAVYFLVGTPRALDPGSATAPASLERATEQLAARLSETPDNLEGWMLLGRSRMALERPARAAEAYKRALRLAPDNPTVMVELAEALAQANGFRLTGEPAALLQAAIRHDPDHQKALWFGGLADWQAGDYSGAVENWEHLLTLLEPGSNVSESVKRQLAAARSRVGDTEAGTRDLPTPRVEARADPVEVRVRVSVADRFADGFSPEDTVFVFARSADGAGMPLAIKRFRAAELPTKVALSAKDAMTDASRLEPGMAVVVTARISKSGSATPNAGDLQGQTGLLIAGEAEVIRLEIDRRLGES